MIVRVKFHVFFRIMSFICANKFLDLKVLHTKSEAYFNILCQ